MEPVVRVFKQTPQGELRLHVFAPSEGRPRSAIVCFVCGAWTGFHPPKHYAHAAYLSTRGALGIVAEVRTIGTHGISPRECVIDAKSAVRWVRGHAHDLGFPSDRIGVFGSSAAGHVSLSTAIIDGFEEVGENRSVSNAPNVILVASPSVLPKLREGREKEESIRALIEKFGGEDEYRKLSPAYHVRSGLPPVLILQGECDKVTLLSDTQRFVDTMLGAGNDCKLIIYPGEGHGLVLHRDGLNPAFATTLVDIDQFLIDHKFLTGQPTIDAFEYSGQTWSPPAVEDRPV